MTVSERADVDLPAPADDRVAGLERIVTMADGVEETFEVVEPYTAEVLGELPACSERDVDAAFERAQTAQSEWADRSIEERAEVLLDYHDLVLDRREELIDVVQLETGKARRDAHQELMDVVLNARHYAVRADDYLTPESRKPAIPLMTKSTVYHHPKGVVGIISPWNYPLNLSIADALPAILAGNTVVLKPAQQTSYTALAGVELLREAGVPDDVFQVVTGAGSELGTPLVESSDYVCFTGSTETGRLVAEQAARNLTQFSMELGGKNPAIVLPDADLEKAARGMVRACFANAGQLCISIERLYVHEDVRDEFLRRFVDEIEDLRIAADYDYDTEYGSIISEEHLEKVESHVEDARARGATIHTGGEARPDVGPYFYEPTVLSDLPDDADAACEETFGPVVTIYEVGDVEEAIERANDSEYGLNASVWTEDLDRGESIATRIECGTVNVNEGFAPAYAATDAPMGGMKDSGMGRRHGDEGIMKYTEPQNVTVQKYLDMGSPPGVSYSTYADVLDTAARVMKKVPGLR